MPDNDDKKSAEYHPLSCAAAPVLPPWPWHLLFLIRKHIKRIGHITGENPKMMCPTLLFLNFRKKTFYNALLSLKKP